MSKIMFHSQEYEVETDAEGRPNKLSRYNKSSDIHITILFSIQKNPMLEKEIIRDLKDISIASINSLTDK